MRSFFEHQLQVLVSIKQKMFGHKGRRRGLLTQSLPELDTLKMSSFPLLIDIHYPNSSDQILLLAIKSKLNRFFMNPGVRKKWMIN